MKLLRAKNTSKKQLIFEKWDHFENWWILEIGEFGWKIKIAKNVLETTVQEH